MKNFILLLTTLVCISCSKYEIEEQKYHATVGYTDYIIDFMSHTKVEAYKCTSTYEFNGDLTSDTYSIIKDSPNDLISFDKQTLKICGESVIVGKILDENQIEIRIGNSAHLFRRIR